MIFRAYYMMPEYGFIVIARFDKTILRHLPFVKNWQSTVWYGEYSSGVKVNILK